MDPRTLADMESAGIEELEAASAVLAGAMDPVAQCVEKMQTGKTEEITLEAFDYFLEVLPPVFMGKKFTFRDGQTVKASFGFAEGYEPITVFWTENGRYFCRRSTVINPLG